MYIDLTDINNWPEGATHCIEGGTFVKWEGCKEFRWNDTDQDWKEDTYSWSLVKYLSDPLLRVTERPKEENSVLDVNPEDLVSEEHLDKLGITYAELASVYFTMGGSNGASTMWTNLCDMFEGGSTELYETLPSNLSEIEIFDYYEHKKEWEAMLFPKATKEKEKTEKINSIRKQIKELKKELNKELEG